MLAIIEVPAVFSLIKFLTKSLIVSRAMRKPAVP